MSVSGAGPGLVRGFNERQQHRERLFRLHGMAQIRRHVEERAGLERVNLGIEAEFAFAGEDLNQRVLRGGVLAELLAFRKTKQDRARVWSIQDGAANDAVGGESGFVSEVEHFGFYRSNERLFFHARNIGCLFTDGFDLRQNRSELRKPPTTFGK